MGSCVKLINSIKSSNGLLITEIFNSLILSSATYETCVASLGCLEDLKKIHLKFFQKILHSPVNTLNNAVRFETMTSAIAVSIFKSCISWLCKLNETPIHRITKLCWLRLLSLAKSDNRTDQLN